MSRSRQFVDAEVLDRVTDVFCMHGYGGTSIAMLTAATGLGKQSLYSSFGDKQALYLRAIDRASSRYAHLAARMAAAATGFAALRLFFDNLLGGCIGTDPVARACIVSAGLLEAIDNDAINTQLCSKWKATQQLLLKSVRRGQADGSVLRHETATALADYLMTVVSGLRVASRLGEGDPTQRRLRATIRQALSLLDTAKENVPPPDSVSP